MASIPHRIIGLSSGGLESFSVLSGTPLVNSTDSPPNVLYSTELALADLVGVITTKPENSPTFLQFGCISFKLFLSDVSPATTFTFFRSKLDTDTHDNFELVLEPDGDLLLRFVGASGTAVASGMSAATWYQFVVIYEKHASNGLVEVYIDGTQIINETGIANLAFGNTTENFEFLGSSDSTVRTAEIVQLSSNTKADFNTDGYDVHEFAIAGTGWTRTGDVPDAGSEGNTGDQPLDEGTTVDSTAASGKALSALTDGTLLSGPNGEGLSGTVAGAEYGYWIKRGNGGGTTFTLLYGNSGDGVSNTVFIPTNSFDWYSTVSVAATVVPLLTEYFDIGASHDGAKDLIIADMYAALAIEIAGGTDATANPTGVKSTGSARVPVIDLDSSPPVTGVKSTGSVGTVGTDFDFSHAVSGVSSAGSVGTVTTGISEDVVVTGVSSNGQVGSVITDFDFSQNLTGVSSTGNIGTVDTNFDFSLDLSGVSSTGNVGTTIQDFDFSHTVTGVSSTSTAGTPTVDIGLSVFPTGVTSTGQVGTVDTNFDFAHTVAGVLSTGSVGTVTTLINENILVTGVSSSSSVGSVTTSISEDVVVTGISSTSSARVPSVDVNEFIDVIGVKSTGLVGTITQSFDFAHAVTGVTSTGIVGDVSVTTSSAINVDVTGVVSVTSIGTVQTNFDIEVFPTGVSSLGKVFGIFTIIIDENIPVTGISSSTNIGTVTTFSDINIAVTGLKTDGLIGTPLVTLNSSVSVTGVSSTTKQGSVVTATIDNIEVVVAGVSSNTSIGEVSFIVHPPVPINVLGTGYPLGSRSPIGSTFDLNYLSNVMAFPSGLLSTGFARTVVVVPETMALVSGVLSLGKVGTIRQYGEPLNWSFVVNPLDPGWNERSENSSSWVERTKVNSNWENR